MKKAILLLLVLLLPVAAWAGQAADASRIPLLDAVREASRNTQSLQSEFTQSTMLKLFDAPLVVTGRVTIQKPDKIRWEYLSPEHSGFILNGSSGMQWRPSSDDGSRSETLANATALSPLLRAMAGQMLLWLNLDQERLQKDFVITVAETGDPRITLVPRDSNMAQYISRIEMVLYPTLVGISRIAITESNGNEVALVFSEQSRNITLPETTFTAP